MFPMQPLESNQVPSAVSSVERLGPQNHTELSN